MRAHEAGALHGNDAAPTWLPYPADVNALIPGLFSQQTRRGDDGALEIGGVSAHAILQQVGSPAFVIDEEDFRARARAFKDAFETAFAPLNGAHVSYAAKAFIATRIARWMAEDGLGLDVCTGGEMAVGLRGGMPADRMTLHGNNKSDAEIERALTEGVGRIVIDSLEEIDRVADIAERLGTTAHVLLRVTSGVEAHTHEFIATAHEDQKFGISITTGDALTAAEDVLKRPSLHLDGLHSHIGSQIFDTHGFEVAARRVLALVKRIQETTGRTCEHLVLGGGFGVMYNTQHTPSTPTALADSLAEIIRIECTDLDLPFPVLGFEPGRAIAGPSTQTLYTVGTTKMVELGPAQRRLYVSVDGGMSDNIRTALYDADYSCLLASRTSDAEPAVVRVVGKHCESGDIVVKDEYLPADVHRGDIITVPVTGAYCYSLASNYNHVPRPVVVSVADGEVSPMIRRETEDDLLARDLG
ncbi:diaminopimelate decarboxylase [Helcobacillus massiliensis]|uniref:Diaminopimelate decarboxylase n=1 Tax=Helcobacillus massiliensis TaxID=521392 RepID=A0A839QXI9_9MICO|nr:MULTISPECIES: diaminopimelate decarboxylase [Helcobacillus]MBB3022107.1 diaminopimelate decarboxylase [Helcobacillus massiliensis]MCG7426827.1 diaminopimelate decarboxylase [Helcobacillus sp. ACRRO]MCT1557367.1 diaminopimelate decarboxylase [Helcobacillus massiliensis]MCT2036910.1 diaminopimelate decarboxylase [Helcobacillus massiliensis]MCT2331652.1 diaminopimelate decarboxylase [Helcobacillus massiliensis]